MKSEAPEDAYFAVAKRVPVRMRFLGRSTSIAIGVGRVWQC